MSKETDLEDLDCDWICGNRGSGPIGEVVKVFRETASTNDLVMTMATGGSPEGLVVVADSQTAGRGQHGRSWHSLAGKGLWFSFLLRPEWPPGTLGSVTPLVAVAVARALVACSGLPIRIKPPNDIYVGQRKLAGILTEARSGRTTIAVVGVGLNVNHETRDFPADLSEIATSLAEECRRPFRRDAVLAGILSELNKAYSRESASGPEIDEEFVSLSRQPDCGSFAA